jgi:hypothetical protein
VGSGWTFPWLSAKAAAVIRKKVKAVMVRDDFMGRPPLGASMRLIDEVQHICSSSPKVKFSMFSILTI